MSKKLKITNSGQSLFEVVVALAVMTLIVVSLVTLSTLAVKNTTYNRDRGRATTYAQEATEWLRGERDTNIDEFKSRITEPTTYCLKTLSWSINRACTYETDKITGTVFKREVFLEQSDVGGKTVIRADIRVYWSSPQGDHEVRSITDFTDWRER